MKVVVWADLTVYHINFCKLIENKTFVEFLVLILNSLLSVLRGHPLGQRTSGLIRQVTS